MLVTDDITISPPLVFLDNVLFTVVFSLFVIVPVSVDLRMIKGFKDFIGYSYISILV